MSFAGKTEQKVASSIHFIFTIFYSSYVAGLVVDANPERRNRWLKKRKHATFTCVTREHLSHLSFLIQCKSVTITCSNPLHTKQNTKSDENKTQAKTKNTNLKSHSHTFSTSFSSCFRKTKAFTHQILFFSTFIRNHEKS